MFSHLVDSYELLQEWVEDCSSVLKYCKEGTDAGSDHSFVCSSQTNDQ